MSTLLNQILGQVYPEEKKNQPDEKKSRPSIVDRLIGYALADLRELFLDQFGQAHALVNGQAVPLHRGCYPWLRRLFYDQEGRGVNGEALQIVSGTLEAKALATGVNRDLHVRSAWHENTLYVELAPGQVVRVDATGWDLDRKPPVFFRRYPNLAPLLLPKAGGSLEDFLDLMPTKTDADRRLLLAYYVTGPFPHVARPILLLIGPQGSGKTTTHRLIKRTLDPGRPETIRLDPRDAIQKSSHCQVAFFDNASHLQDWAIDILCRLVTGEGDSKRRLYTDDEDVIYELKRLVLLNGINPPADRPDFTDRCLPIELERLEDHERMEEGKLWAYVDQEHPRWLGALFDLLAKALAVRPTLQLPWLPRLADWGTYAAAVYEAAGYKAETFLTDWRTVVEKQHQSVIEGSPVAQALLELMADREAWIGTVSQLYADLTGPGERLKLTTDRAWPRSTKGLGKRLRELQPVLADRGLRLTFERSPDADRTRLVTLQRAPNRNVQNVHDVQVCEN